MQRIKRFIKELKRVRWPTLGQTGNTFVKAVLFIAVSALFLLGLALFFAFIWRHMGIGL
ncbi:MULTISPECIES: preprotein translocase subunit SecE [unclassified Mycoplasma]|uniref:preprotein translocase subunit SecE n=1 Tax=unclassified Mycoplasma TaxID=2683645 RepID=UPI000FDEA47B